MSLVTSLASRAAQAALIGPGLARMKRELIRGIVGSALLTALGGIGLLYLLTALRTELERHLGPAGSPLVIAFAFCTLAGIVYLLFLRLRRSDAETAKAADVMTLARFVRPARRLESKLADHPWLSAAGSLSTGLIAALLVHLLRARGGRSTMPRAGNGLDSNPWSRQVVIRESEAQGSRRK